MKTSTTTSKMMTTTSMKQSAAIANKQGTEEGAVLNSLLNKSNYTIFDEVHTVLHTTDLIQNLQKMGVDTSSLGGEISSKRIDASETVFKEMILHIQEEVGGDFSALLNMRKMTMESFQDMPGGKALFEVYNQKLKKQAHELQKAT